MIDLECGCQEGRISDKSRGKEGEFMLSDATKEGLKQEINASEGQAYV